MFATDELSFDEINADGEAVYSGSHFVSGSGSVMDFTYEVIFDSTIEEGICEVLKSFNTFIVSVGCSCISDSPSTVPSITQPNNDDVDENTSDDEGSDDDEDDDNEVDTSNECCDRKDIQNTLFSKIKDAFVGNWENKNNWMKERKTFVKKETIIVLNI